MLNRCVSLIFFIGLAIITGLTSSISFAIESTDTLPVGIYSPSIITGHVFGLSNRFTDSGQLVTQGDYRSIDLDAKRLTQINSDFKSLVQVLDSFGHFELGQQIDPGRIKIDLEPTVTYVAPNLAYGINNKWTVAAALPFLKYHNEVRFSQTQSNIGQLKEELGGSSEELDDAFDQLSGDLPAQLQKEVVSSGYNPLGSRDETLVGDLQLISMYRFYQTPIWSTSLQNTLTLPTGRDQDPNDLLSLDIFGRTSISTDFVLGRKLNSKVTLNGFFGYEYFLPDSVEKRLPKDQDDLLPSQEQKINTHRQIGGLFTTGINGSYNVTTAFSTALGLNYNNKQKDRYSGGMSGDYDALSTNSNANWSQARVQLQYSTVEAYNKKEFLIPFIIQYGYSQILKGMNREQQKIHQLTLRMFLK